MLMPSKKSKKTKKKQKNKVAQPKTLFSSSGRTTTKTSKRITKTTKRIKSKDAFKERLMLAKEKLDIEPLKARKIARNLIDRAMKIKEEQKRQQVLFQALEIFIKSEEKLLGLDSEQGVEELVEE